MTEPPLTAAEIRREITRLQAALTDERNFFVHPGDDADPEGDVRRQIADLLDNLSDLEQTRIEAVDNTPLPVKILLSPRERTQRRTIERIWRKTYGKDPYVEEPILAGSQQEWAFWTALLEEVE